LRRTKIVATFGPATEDPKVIDKLIEAGLDVVRLNFSHERHEVHMKRAETVRERAKAHGREIGVIVDLQGPKIRIGKFKAGRITLQEGETFILDVDHPLDAGNQERVGITYHALPQDVERGATLLLDDGRVVLWVDKVDGNAVICRVVVGGELSNSKGINRQGGGLTAKALTDKDREDIRAAARMQADYVAISFPRSADDVNEARQLLRAAGGHGGIIAKIERTEAVQPEVPLRVAGKGVSRCIDQLIAREVVDQLDDAVQLRGSEDRVDLGDLRQELGAVARAGPDRLRGQIALPGSVRDHRLAPVQPWVSPPDRRGADPDDPSSPRPVFLRRRPGDRAHVPGICTATTQLDPESGEK